MTSQKSPITLKNLQSLILLMSKRKVSPVEVQIDHIFKKKKALLIRGSVHTHRHTPVVSIQINSALQSYLPLQVSIDCNITFLLVKYYYFLPTKY